MVKREKKTKHLNKNKKIIIISCVLILVISFAASIIYFSASDKANRTGYVPKTSNDNTKRPSATISVVPKTYEEMAVFPKTPGRDEISTLINVNDDEKVAYLTFDDGPSPNNTPVILDILQKQNIKATFFIIGQNAERNPEMLKREKDMGETIGMHSYCHNTSIIYKNPNAYLDDLQKCSKAMSGILGENGYDKWLIRFPEGSSAVKNKPGFKQVIANAGYHYVDWNALVGDAEKSAMASPDYLMTRLETTVGNQHHVVILMHDAQAKESTAATLPKVIEYLKEKGFVFKQIPAFR